MHPPETRQAAASAGGRGRHLRVLIAEDSEDDALLVVRSLRRAGFSPEYCRVDSTTGLRAALDGSDWELIVTDYNMPQFSPDDVLAAVGERDLDVPIILVSAHVADRRAVDAMKAGVHDYVLKDNLSRLAPAVERELREAENRRAHRLATAQLEHVARHDALTGLANRRQVEERLAAVLDAVDERGHAFLYLDIDQFHLVNDTGSHRAGDALICGLARVLSRHVRESDTLARMGPDEFGMLLERCPLSRAWRIAEQIRQAVGSYRLELDSQTYQVQCSIGVVAVTDAGLTVADVLRRADLACHAAKDLGRNRIRVYSEEDTELVRRHGDMKWVGRLRQALERDQFVVHYQPIRALDSGLGPPMAELLVRMVDDDGQLILPDRFIPAAERFDLMPFIDRWVIQNGLSAIARADERQGREGMWSINLSARSLSDDDLPTFVDSQLRRHALEAGRICFEITETAAIANVNSALRFMQHVRNLGCTVALDDFGSGLSSFNYLKSMPAAFLKIDGSFVRGMLDSPLDHTIVDAITRIGHAAGMRVIAEFAETESVLEALRGLDVDFAQGHAVATPRAFDET